MTGTTEPIYFLNQDNWKKNNIYNTYPRQPYMNSFENSIENLEKHKNHVAKISSHTVPVSPNDVLEEKISNSTKPFKKKPCICRYFINICKIVGSGWLVSTKNYYRLDRADLLWCVPDICGSICAIVTWLLIGYATFVVIFVMVLPAPSFYFKWINGVGFVFLSSLAFLSHLKSMLTNPGTVSLGTATSENIQKVCTDSKKTIYKCVKCNSIKPQRAHHCSICQRCVVKMDHHCPWVNNCIGENNQKYFVLFTFYICVISIYSIYISIHFFIMCVGSEWEECKDGFSPAASTILIVFLLVEGVLFGLFTAIMCGEQLQSIWADETGIENLKKERATWERKSKWANMQSLFGYPISWRWLCPLAEPNFQLSVSEKETNSLHIV